MERLDALVSETRIDVMKVDVEGHELAVLKGASALLDRRAIRNIVFEEHGGAKSPVCLYLLSKGYKLFSLGWRTFGPACGPIEELRRNFRQLSCHP